MVTFSRFTFSRFTFSIFPPDPARPLAGHYPGIPVNLLPNIKLTVISAAAAAATTAVNSSIIDMTGFDGVLFVAVTGVLTISSVVTLTIQENTLNQTGGMTAIPAGNTAAYTALGTETLNGFQVDVYRPQQEFLRAVLTRSAANAVVNSIVAIQYQANHKPTVQDASVLASAFVAPTS
jgi:hypothetical protein